jgi:hypothetical protein
VRRIEPDSDHPSRPVLYFFGEMHEPSTSTMTGSVRMTPDNQVEWKFVNSSYLFIVKHVFDIFVGLR